MFNFLQYLICSCTCSQKSFESALPSHKAEKFDLNAVFKLSKFSEEFAHLINNDQRMNKESEATQYFNMSMSPSVCLSF